MNSITYANVPFLYRVSKNPDFNIPVLGPIIKCSEKYWSFGDGKARVVSTLNKSFKAELKFDQGSWFKTALKILAVVTIVPLILLGIKWLSRQVRPVVYAVEPLRTPSPSILHTPPDSPSKTPSPSSSQDSSEQYISSPSPDTTPVNPSEESDSEENKSAIEPIATPADKVHVPIKTDEELPYFIPVPAAAAEKKHLTINDEVVVIPIPKKIRIIDGFPVDENGCVTLSTRPVHLARIFKEETDENLWYTAKKNVKEGNHQLAMVYYIDYALITQRNDVWSSKGEKAIKRALELHEKFYGKDLFPHIKIESEKFFALVKHIRDYRKLTELQVMKKIHQVPELTQRPPLQIPIVSLPDGVEPTDIKVGPYRAAVHSRMNRRADQEDRYLMTEFSIEQENQPPVKAQLFGVFDGHGGFKTAEYLRDHLVEALQEGFKEYPDLSEISITNALIQSCVDFNDSWLSDPECNDGSGSTATCVMIINETVWFFNVGDSRSLISCDNQVAQGSEDAKASSQIYLNGVLKRGGNLSNNSGWRLGGVLALTRAFGDKDSIGLTARPDILKCELYKLNPTQNNFLILASDGLWDVVGSKDAAHMINLKIPGLNRNPTPEELAYYLTETAAAHATHDNCTVITVNLTPTERPAAASAKQKVVEEKKIASEAVTSSKEGNNHANPVTDADPVTSSPEHETLADEQLSVENSATSGSPNRIVGE